MSRKIRKEKNQNELINSNSSNGNTNNSTVAIVRTQPTKEEREKREKDKQKKRAEKILRDREFIQQVQKFVGDYDLNPILQTSCDREHFEHSDVPNIRITLDTNLRMYR